MSELNCSGSLKLATDIEFFHTFGHANKVTTDAISNTELSKAVLAKHVSGPLLLSAKVFLQPVILLLPYL
ncbi:hypothetical protein AT730_24290 (plasmid) [Vibrio alginolyticus]|nr:hypothetical protein AT730_24290 [Vibrio alginolyticus]